MFYLMMHSTHFILRLFGVRHMVKDYSIIISLEQLKIFLTNKLIK